MVASWLLGNFDRTLFGANIFEGSDREVGNAFVPETDGRITGLRWCRASNTPTTKPTILRVWDTTTGTVVYSVSPVPDSTGLGWKEEVVADTPTVYARRQYIVSSGWQTNRAHTLYGLGNVPPPDFPLHGWHPMGRITNDPAIGYPGNNNTGYVYGVDVRVRSQQRPLVWTLQATTAYSETLKWPQPANGYRLTITTIGEWRTAQVVAGEDIRRIVGAWWPISDGYKGERRPIDAPQSDLRLPGLPLIDGLLLDTGPGSAGTVEAYTVDDLA